MPKLFSFLSSSFDFVGASSEKRGAVHWRELLERSATGNLHSHLVLQLRTAVDKTGFRPAFKRMRAKRQCQRFAHQRMCRKSFGLAIGRSFFQASADKDSIEKKTEAAKPMRSGITREGN